jgi:hypothetical protein
MLGSRHGKFPESDERARRNAFQWRQRGARCCAWLVRRTHCRFALAALFLFGYVKGRFTGVRPLRSALQTVIIGGIAAAAAFGLARVVA